MKPKSRKKATRIEKYLPFEKYVQEKSSKHNKLLSNIKASLPELEKLLTDISGHWKYEDLIYRFYHQSFKVYWVQEETLKIVESLRKLSPNKTNFLNDWFEQIYSDGVILNREFEMSHNDNWLLICRPKIEAFLHAKFFLEMAIKYGKELKEAPNVLPSGWAAVLYLYDLR